MPNRPNTRDFDKLKFDVVLYQKMKMVREGMGLDTHYLFRCNDFHKGIDDYKEYGLWPLG